jgi:putative ABC transport system permease protein
MVAIGVLVTIAGSMSVRTPVMLAGLVIGEVGLVLCTPGIVGLISRAGRILPLAPRIALRDAARNRAAAAPAISAVMAAVAGSVAIGLYLDSSHVQQRDTYQLQAPVGTIVVHTGLFGPDLAAPAPTPVLESTIRAAAPIGQVARLSRMACPIGSPAEAYCGMRAETVPELRCPYLDPPGVRELTRDERRAARADARCDLSLIAEAEFVDDGTALAALTGATGEDLAKAQTVLRAGGVVVRNPNVIKDGTVTMVVMETSAPNAKGEGQKLRTEAMTFPAHLLTTGVDRGQAIVSPGAVTRAGLTTREGAVVASTTRMPTQTEEDRLVAQLESLNAYPSLERGAPTSTDSRVLVLLGAATAITLGAAGIGTGLAAADGRADLSTLAAVGASPGVRRGLSLSQSGVIAGLGSVLGTLAGVGAAVAIIVSLNQTVLGSWPGPDPLPIVVPWLSLGVALVGAPLLAVLGAGLFTRSRLPIERRQ